MAATLTLDWNELLWWLQGGMRGSHLRWSVYEDFVNKVYPQLSDKEREAKYTYAKRDLNYWEGKSEKEIFDKTPHEYFKHLLARFNPTNQYHLVVEFDGEREEVDAYLWEGLYYIDWQRYCNQDYIKSVERRSFRKCVNNRCAKHLDCVRYANELKEGEEIVGGDTPRVWACDKCDFFCGVHEDKAW